MTNHPSRGRKAKTILVRCDGAWLLATRWHRDDIPESGPACWVVGGQRFPDWQYEGSTEQSLAAALRYINGSRSIST
jgi:hypothetical protein